MLTPDQQKLVLDNRGFAGACARYWFRRNPHADYEDLRQAAYLGLTQAAEKFDVGRGLKFITYANFWVAKECREVSRKTAIEYVTRHGWRSGYRPLEPLPLEHIAHRATQPISPTPVVDAEAILDRVPDDRERLVLRLWMHGARLVDIGRRLGVSRERARQIKLRGVERCREMIGLVVA